MGRGKVNIISGVSHPLGGVGKYLLCKRLLKTYQCRNCDSGSVLVNGSQIPYICGDSYIYIKDSYI